MSFHIVSLVCHYAAQGIEGAEVSIPLEVVGPNISEALQEQYPYLKGCSTLRVPQDQMEKVSWSGRLVSGLVTKAGEWVLKNVKKLGKDHCLAHVSVFGAGASFCEV
jgi:hypothetical protein